MKYMPVKQIWPSWRWIACPVCGAASGKNCVNLADARRGGRARDPLLFTTKEPHAARVQKAEAMPA